MLEYGVTLMQEALKLANLGAEEAVRRLPELRPGLNTWRGQLTCQPVAEALSLPFSEVSL
ncbi:MAG: hypothetical protein OSB41_03045 [Kiritimatiellae bacterium]|nr:hypothetical protein [Kiritimatiellia bacterium]